MLTQINESRSQVENGGRGAQCKIATHLPLSSDCLVAAEGNPIAFDFGQSICRIPQAWKLKPVAQFLIPQRLLGTQGAPDPRILGGGILSSVATMYAYVSFWLVRLVALPTLSFSFLEYSSSSNCQTGRQLFDSLSSCRCILFFPIYREA